MTILAFMLGERAHPTPSIELSKGTKVNAVRFTGFFNDPAGAVGIPYLDDAQRLPTKAWQDAPAMLRRAVKVKEPINLMRLSLKIDLSDGTQVLFDKYSRFVRVPSKLEALTSYKGPVYELRSSDFREILFKLYQEGRIP